MLKRKNSTRENPDKAGKKEEAIMELDRQQLDRISGGVDPFSTLPRVPDQPITPDLREDA